MVVPDRPASTLPASPDLVAWACAAEGIDVPRHAGPIWTTAALLAEGDAEINAWHRENGIQIVQNGDILQQGANQHLLVCLTVICRFVRYASVVVGTSVSAERSLAEWPEITSPHQLACIGLRRDVRTQYSHDTTIEVAQDS